MDRYLGCYQHTEKTLQGLRRKRDCIFFPQSLLFNWDSQAEPAISPLLQSLREHLLQGSQALAWLSQLSSFSKCLPSCKRPRPGLPRPSCACRASGPCLKMHILRFCICNQLPGGATTIGQRTTLWLQAVDSLTPLKHARPLQRVQWCLVGGMIGMASRGTAWLGHHQASSPRK